MEKYIRKLARSNRWQILYAKSKELNGIRLFENELNHSQIQLHFLYWLSMYNSMYQDLAMKETFLTKEVIEDDIECDAYLHYKETVNPNKDKEVKKQNFTGIPSLVQKVRGN